MRPPVQVIEKRLPKASAERYRIGSNGITCQEQERECRKSGGAVHGRDQAFSRFNRVGTHPGIGAWRPGGRGTLIDAVTGSGT